jgi:hypothetical protein
MTSLTPSARTGVDFWRAFTRPRTFLPQDHGSFVLFAAPLAVGIGVGRAWGPRVVAFAVAALALFLLRQPLDLLIRGLRGKRTAADRPAVAAWVGIYTALALAAGAYLLLAVHLWGLLWLIVPAAGIVALQLWASAARQSRAGWNEVIGVAGLGLAAPGAYYVATGAWSATAFALWALAALQGIGGVLYSRWRLARRQAALRAAATSRSTVVSRYEAARPVGVVVGHQMAAVVGALALAAVGWAPWIVAPFYVLLLARVLWGTRPGAAPDRTIIGIGTSEFVATALTAVWLVLAFRWG